MAQSWRCPYCDQIATLLDDNISDSQHNFNHDNKDGYSALKKRVIVCPNTQCRDYTITVALHRFQKSVGGHVLGRSVAEWTLKPSSAAKLLP
jgi:hypothetical protein